MGTAVRPANTSPGSWDAFADVDVFVDLGTGRARRHRKEWCPAVAIGAKAAAGRSGAAHVAPTEGPRRQPALNDPS